jgi:hypothetical protein
LGLDDRTVASPILCCSIKTVLAIINMAHHWRQYRLTSDLSSLVEFRAKKHTVFMNLAFSFVDQNVGRKRKKFMEYQLDDLRIERNREVIEELERRYLKLKTLLLEEEDEILQVLLCDNFCYNFRQRLTLC